VPLKIKFCPVCGFRFVTPTETDTACTPQTRALLRPMGDRFDVWRCSLCRHFGFHAWDESAIGNAVIKGEWAI
jgi:hypothetical protein